MQFLLNNTQLIEYDKQMQGIKNVFNGYKIIPYSAEKKIGVGMLVEEMSKKSDNKQIYG